MTTEPQPQPTDPILVAMEKEEETKPKKPKAEPVRTHPLRRCDWYGHRFGMAWEDGSLDVPVKRLVCIRGRGTLKGRCPVERQVVAPDDTPMVPERPMPTFYLPVSEYLRLLRHDWGEALDGPYPTREEV